jgi:hypothetical protein
MSKLVGVTNGTLKYKVTRESYLDVLRALNGLVASTRRKMNSEIEVTDLSVVQDDEGVTAFVSIHAKEKIPA